MNCIDFNCLIGHWPFRKIRKHTFTDLINIHRSNGVTHAYVSSINAVFYNDPFEGDEELNEIICKTHYYHVLTINPLLPGALEDIKKGITMFGIKGVRIYPSYHGYNADTPTFREMCSILKNNNLPLFISLRLEDDRLNYMIKPNIISIQELRNFLKSALDCRVILLNILYNELIELKDIINSASTIFFDVSGLKHYNFIFDLLLEHFPIEKILYGSQYPLLCMKSTLYLVKKSDIPIEYKEQIFYKNALQIGK